MSEAFRASASLPSRRVLTVDGVEYSIFADPTMASLKAIREIAEHVRPRRGCQEGICGKCESKVDGQDTRLCITPIGTLMGAVVVTPHRERASGAENHRSPIVGRRPGFT